MSPYARTGPAVGIALPTNRVRLTGPVLRSVVGDLSAAGCASVWVNDHLAAFPADAETYPYHPSRRVDWAPETPQYEALTVCAFVAAICDRLRFGTSVLVLPQRHPLEVAKATATLADLSGGRFMLGVGAGWSRREMRLLGWDPATRGTRLDEQLAILRAAWGTAELTAEVRHYSWAQDVIIEPKPRPGEAPLILIGGMSQAALRRVRRYGDGWLAAAGPDIAQLRAAGRQLMRLRETAGRPLLGSVKIALPTPDPAWAADILAPLTEDGWDEVTFEFGLWDADGARALVKACVERMGGNRCQKPEH